MGPDRRGAGEAAHDLVAALLWSLAAELQGSGLLSRRGRQALVVYLEAATAERLGSDRWMPIVTLAGPPWPAGRRDLALEVFAAANHPRSSAELPGQAIPAAHRAATTPPSLREVQ